MQRLEAKIDALAKENAALRERMRRIESPRQVVGTPRTGQPALNPGLAANAADYPTKGFARPVYTSWAGPYIGAHAGVARHEGRFDDFNQGTIGPTGTQNGGGCIQTNNNDACGSHLANEIGFIGGGQIGYNWQAGSLVYGVEADASWLSAKLDTDLRPNRDNLSVTVSQKIDWLVTLRGRAGLAVDRTLIYFTGGLALAGVKNSVDGVCTGRALGRNCTSDDNIRLSAPSFSSA